MSDTIQFNEANVVSSIRSFLDSFEDTFAALSHRRSLNVAGAEFSVRSHDVSYLDQANRALATRDGPFGDPCRIAVVNASDHLGPTPFWPHNHFIERQIEEILKNTPYRLHFYQDLNFWQVFDVDKAIGVQWMQTPDGFPAWDTGSPLRNFVQWRLAKDDISLLHGGTLAVAGNGALLAGEGGAGKSSTVLAGIFAGLQSVGDDYVLVDVSQQTARPVFDTLKQDETGLRRLGQWGHPAIPNDANWQGKHQFYMGDVSAAPLIAELPLKALMLPDLTFGPTTTITPIDAKTAFLALAPSGVSQIHCDRARLFSVAGKLARQLPAFRLKLGTEPDEIVAALRTFMEDARWP